MEGEKHLETSRISKLKELFNKDAYLRVLSVFIAIILWAYVSYVLDPEIQKEFVNIPVKFINEQSLLSNGLTLVDDNYTVSFEIKGRRNIISSIDKDRLTAIADLSDYTKLGRNRVSVKISGLPSSVQIITEPQDIFVELDKAYSVQKPIKVATKGEPQKGYSVYNPTVNPTTVQIDGPQRLINSIYDVRIVVDISNVDNSFVTKERVSIIDNKGNEIRGLKSNVEMAEVSVPIVKTKEVPLRANVTGVPAKDSYVGKITLSPDKVFLFGNQDKIKQINEIKLDQIDITGLSDSISRNVKINLPLNVNVLGSDGYVKVDITIQKKAAKVFSIPISNIQIKDKKPNLNYSFTQDKIDITAQGTQDSLNNLNSSSITASVSVKDLGEGQYSIALVVSLPQGVTILKPDNLQISLKISS